MRIGYFGIGMLILCGLLLLAAGLAYHTGHHRRAGRLSAAATAVAIVAGVLIARGE